MFEQDESGSTAARPRRDVRVVNVLLHEIDQGVPELRRYVGLRASSMEFCRSLSCVLMFCIVFRVVLIFDASF